MPATETRDTWRGHYATPAGHRYWPCEELVRAVGGRTFARVLDAGCGNGSNLWFLAEHADSVVGVDGCVEAVLAADEYLHVRGCSARATVMLGDVQAVPAPSGSFDAVVDVMTAQHLPWPKWSGLLAEYRRLLKAGGWLFMYDLGHGTTTRGARHIGAFTYDELPALFPGVGPVCLPQAPALKSALVSAGFHPAPTRLLSRTYADAAVTAYIVQEATAI